MDQEQPTPSLNIPPAIVIDNGSGLTKIGIAGDTAPRACFSTLIGRPKSKGIMVGMDPDISYIGEEAQSKRGVLKLNYPLEHGIVTDWDDLEEILYYSYLNELKISSQEHPVLITETPLNPISNSEKIAEIFFEKFNVPYLYIANPAPLALYASARTTGLVLDSGDGVTMSVPIYEGYAINHAIKRNDFGGRDLNEYMVNLLLGAGIALRSQAGREIAREIKEKTCYVSLNYESESNNPLDPSKNVQYRLPDRNIINIGEQRFRCAEALFQPSKIGKDAPGIHEIVLESIKKCDMDIRKEMYSNIVLSGGSTLISGIVDRIAQEITNKIPSSIKIKIDAPPERKYSNWIGGSILGALSTFQNIWTTQKEYKENLTMRNYKNSQMNMMINE